MKEWRKGSDLISTDKSKLQLDRMHRYLSREAYWSLGIPKDVIARSNENSITFGVYSADVQIGFARVVTDYATFAWLADVYIESSHRGRGLSKWLMECVMEVVRPMKLRRFLLATKDAHDLYRKYGFEVTKYPERWMEIRDDEIYVRFP